MKNSSITICNETIFPGEILSLALPLPQLFSCAPLYMPIKIIHGKEAGPCLLVTAAMHGNELNGTEIVNRLISTLTNAKICGTLIAIPVLNVYGLISRSRYLPGGVDLDTCFPGTKNGTHAERTAYIFTSEIFSKANICIDLQTGFMNCSNLPQLYTNFNNETERRLARAFNTPIILDQIQKEGSLRQLSQKQNIPFLLYEAGEAMRFDDHAINTGLKGILNVMRELEMLRKKQSIKENAHQSSFAKHSIWIRASTSGISHTKLKLGQWIKKGEALCIIKDPFGTNDHITVYSPVEGIIIGKNNLPLVQEGEKIFQIAFFSEVQQVLDSLELWDADVA
ncbi:MAG: peptidase M14 [Gammaproteobacteria bacterium RIFCSPHIGHO2_12_FULL_38_14]|nr:MAG: peptidase M14 [Gammaproteobacteria bacterium RIFCSPHIGHO2_12_FULL_38_14]